MTIWQCLGWRDGDDDVDDDISKNERRKNVGKRETAAPIVVSSRKDVVDEIWFLSRWDSFGISVLLKMR